MGHIIAKFGDRYMDWTTVSDGPLTPLLTLPELKRYIVERYGYKALDELPERLARIEKFGTSSQMGTTAEDLLSNNSCGPGRKCVESAEEMIRLFGPDGEQPGFSYPDRLDVEEPLKLRVQYGLGSFTAKVTKINAVHGDVVLAEVSIPDVPGTFPVLFDREGTVLTKNFDGLEVVYDRD
jgi:hypothetical protein